MTDPTTSTAPRLESLSQASARTGIPLSQWQQWVRDGKIKAAQPGGPNTKQYLLSSVVDEIFRAAGLEPEPDFSTPAPGYNPATDVVLCDELTGHRKVRQSRMSDFQRWAKEHPDRVKVPTYY